MDDKNPLSDSKEKLSLGAVWTSHDGGSWYALTPGFGAGKGKRGEREGRWALEWLITSVLPV